MININGKISIYIRKENKLENLKQVMEDYNG